VTATACFGELLEHRPRAIVIGGSAGGIEALRVLLPALSADLPVPVLIVMHIAAGSGAEWSRVFHGAAVPIHEAEDKDRAEPGHVYLSPPDYHLLVDASRTLSLSVEEPVQLARPSIDVLFESAAWAFQRELLAIVLSGANADGAAGLFAVRRAGGLCWVQAPDTAAATSMPRAALAAVPDARSLTLEQMMEVLHGFRG
jgi:two-component system, chemotaxis family, protein-glutamate methylesterase/glutaminase